MRKSANQFDMFCRKRGAEGRHHGGEAGLMQGDRVKVALDDYNPIGLSDSLSGDVEAVESPTLAEQRGLR